MTERKNSHSWALALNAISIALVAVLATQVFHESCHAIASVLVGARLKWFNLFAVDHDWVGEMNRWGEIIIAGNAPLMNLVTGGMAAALFSRRWVMRRPTLRLFLLYFGIYSLSTGFGYLIRDALVYQPEGQNLGDLSRVLELLDETWPVRILMGLIGAAGYRWVMLWLARSTLRFGEGMAERSRRLRLALSLLMAPYLTINVIFTVLSFWHPIGTDGILVTAFQYWIGYSAFLLAFGASYWTEVDTAPPDATPLQIRLSWPWAAGAAVALGVAVAVLLPTVHF